jgi:uncharacterized repeat protein (TIGR01451 family)
VNKYMMTTQKIVSIALTVAMAIAGIASISPVSANDCPHNANFSYCPSNKADKTVAERGDVINYTASVYNNGNATLHTVFMAEHFSPYVTYVAGSTTATKGTQTVHITDAWINDGVNFGDLQVGQTVTIHFQAKVNSNAPDNAFIESTAQFKTNDLPNWIQCAAQTTLKHNDKPHYSPSKVVDQATAKPGDVLTYTLKMVNDGNVTLHSAFMADHLPTGVSYINGSTTATKGSQTVTVTDAWLKDGLNLGDLTVGQTVTVTFKVKVNSDVKNGQLLENTGQFKTNELPNWIQCAAQTKVVVKPTPTPTPTPTATPTPTPTPTPTGEVLGSTPTPTPPTELPATGPGMAVLVALVSTTGALIGRKYLLGR